MSITQNRNISLNDPDSELLHLAQMGNREAFDKIVKKYQERIFNVILRMVGNYETALDLTQETFLKAYKNISSFKEQSLFFTWLFRIAMNISITTRQQYAVRPKNIFFSQCQSNSEEKTYEVKDSYQSPEHAIIQQEMNSIVQKAIANLPPEFKQVLVLRDIEGLSYEEIQAILNCPMGTVRSRIHRAREMLKEKLSGI